MSEHRLKALTVEIIKTLDPDTAADVILSMFEKGRSLPAAPSQAKALVPLNGGAKRTAHKRGPKTRPHLPPVDPDKEYAAKDAAKLMGMNLGYFRVWYAQAGNIAVIRKSVQGMTRCSFTGHAILEARARRFGEQGGSDGS